MKTKMFRAFLLILLLMSLSICVNISVVAQGNIDPLGKEKKEMKTAQEAAKAAKAEAEKAQTEAEIQKQTAELAKKKLETEIKETDAVKKEAEILKKEARSKEAIKEVIEKTKQEEKEDQLAVQRAELAEVKMFVAQKKSEIAIEALKLEQAKLAVAEMKLKEKESAATWYEKALESIAIILMGILLFFLLNILIRKIEKLLTPKNALRESEATLRIKTTMKIFSWLGMIAIVIIVIYMVLENHGFNLAPLLAGAGIMGLAFGFGGQYLIRDLINGLFILIEGQYRINDVVKIGEFGGLVEDVNLRITTLRDLAGRVIIVPNGEVKTVVNYTRDYAQALLDIGVAYKENVDQVMSIIKEISKEMRQDKYYGRLIIGNIEMFGVDEFADSAVIIKFRIKTLPIRQWEVMREFRRRLKNRFDALGIEIPFPHRTVYWGTGKENAWVKDAAEKIASK